MPRNSNRIALWVVCFCSRTNLYWYVYDCSRSIWIFNSYRNSMHASSSAFWKWLSYCECWFNLWIFRIFISYSNSISYILLSYRIVIIFIDLLGSSSMFFSIRVHGNLNLQRRPVASFVFNNKIARPLVIGRISYLRISLCSTCNSNFCRLFCRIISVISDTNIAASYFLRQRRIKFRTLNLSTVIVSVDINAELLALMYLELVVLRCCIVV